MENQALLFQPPDRRYKILQVSLSLLGELLFNTRVDAEQKEVRAVEIEGLPGVCRIVAICFDPLRDCAFLRLWSPEWPDLPECAILETLAVTVRDRCYRVAVKDDTGDYDGKGIILLTRAEALAAGLKPVENDAVPGQAYEICRPSGTSGDGLKAASVGFAPVSLSFVCAQCCELFVGPTFLAQSYGGPEPLPRVCSFRCWQGWHMPPQCRSEDIEGGRNGNPCRCVRCQPDLAIRTWRCDGCKMTVTRRGDPPPVCYRCNEKPMALYATFTVGDVPKPGHLNDIRLESLPANKDAVPAALCGHWYDGCTCGLEDRGIAPSDHDRDCPVREVMWDRVKREKGIATEPVKVPTLKNYWEVE